MSPGHNINIAQWIDLFWYILYEDAYVCPSESFCMSKSELLICLIAGEHGLASGDEGRLLAWERPPWNLPGGETGSE